MYTLFWNTLYIEASEVSGLQWVVTDKTELNKKGSRVTYFWLNKLNFAFKKVILLLLHESKFYVLINWTEIPRSSQIRRVIDFKSLKKKTKKKPSLRSKQVEHLFQVCPTFSLRFHKTPKQAKTVNQLTCSRSNISIRCSSPRILTNWVMLKSTPGTEK